MNWYKYSQNISQIYDENKDDYGHNITDDHKFKAKGILNKHNIPVGKDMKNLSHIVHDDSYNVQGALSSYWTYEGNNAIFSLDIGFRNDFSSYDTMIELFNKASQKYIEEKTIQEQNGYNTELKFTIMNPRLALLVIRKYQNIFDEMVLVKYDDEGFPEHEININDYQQLYSIYKDVANDLRMPIKDLQDLQNIILEIKKY